MSRQQLRTTLGEPSAIETFLLGERRDEFHVELQNTYPLANPANAAVPIEEWHWAHGACRLTVWLHRIDGEWRVLMSLEWHRDVAF